MISSCKVYPKHYPDMTQISDGGWKTNLCQGHVISSLLRVETTKFRYQPVVCHK